MSSTGKGGKSGKGKAANTKSTSRSTKAGL
jgi:hypothetical protein